MKKGWDWTNAKVVPPIGQKISPMSWTVSGATVMTIVGCHYSVTTLFKKLGNYWAEIKCSFKRNFEIARAGFVAIAPIQKSFPRNL